MNDVVLSIIIVNYNSGKVLLECINSIKEKKFNFKYEVIIVDNLSTDNSMDFNCDNCHKIYLKENVGFVKANNIAFKNSKGKYIYFLNPDTILLDNKIDELINYLEKNEKVGIVAPKVLNPDYSLQHNCRKEPTLRRLAFYLFEIDKIFNNFKYFTGFKMEHENYNSILFPDWVSGAAFIIKRDLFEKAGMFDENIFMYWEDVILCKEVRKLGYKIAFNPVSQIIHYGGVSSRKVKYFSALSDIKSRYYYFSKYYSKSYYLFIKIITISNLFLRFIFEFFYGRKDNASNYRKILHQVTRL